jgi:3-hydroxyacyl-[acyl-carrier-protein] dehydratase
MGDIFQFRDIQNIEGNRIQAKVAFDSQHAVFEGHFPGLPVLPGVVMLAMVKRLLEMELKKRLLLNAISAVKYLAVINPEMHPEVILEIKYLEPEAGVFQMDAQLSHGDLVFFKLSKARYC